MFSFDGRQRGKLSTPNDFQPNSHKGVEAVPQIILRAMPAPPGMAYTAAGMQRALDSAIGLPSRSTSASWMLVFLIPAEVRRSLVIPLLFASLETLVNHALVMAYIIEKPSKIR